MIKLTIQSPVGKISDNQLVSIIAHASKHAIWFSIFESLDFTIDGQLQLYREGEGESRRKTIKYGVKVSAVEILSGPELLAMQSLCRCQETPHIVEEHEIYIGYPLDMLSGSGSW